MNKIIYANDRKGKDMIGLATAKRYFVEGIPFYAILEND